MCEATVSADLAATLVPGASTVPLAERTRLGITRPSTASRPYFLTSMLVISWTAPRARSAMRKRSRTSSASFFW